MDDDLKEATRLDAVLTVADAKHLLQHLDEEKPEDVVNEAGARAPGLLLQPAAASDAYCGTGVYSSTGECVAVPVRPGAAPGGARVCVGRGRPARPRRCTLLVQTPSFSPRLGPRAQQSSRWRLRTASC